MLIVIAIVRYQNRLKKHQAEIIEFKQEALKAELEIKEQTMNDISYEIHNNLGQILSLVKLNLATMIQQQDFQKLTFSYELVGQAIEDLRNLSKLLSSDYIARLDFIQEVNTRVENCQKSGLSAQLSILGVEKPLQIGQKYIVLRMIQEILNNSIKHSQADEIKLLIYYKTDYLYITIQDNGIGFDTSTHHQPKNNGLGLQSLSQRAKSLGGNISIESQLQKGTTVELSIPLQI
jgi:two-component system, NarL family, sensor kinase